MEKIKVLIKKVCTKEVILYIIFGVLTTIINLAVFALLNSAFKINENLANAIAIIIAVLVAYFTNKDMVFHSEANDVKSKLIIISNFFFITFLRMLILL